MDDLKSKLSKLKYILVILVAIVLVVSVMNFSYGKDKTVTHKTVVTKQQPVQKQASDWIYISAAMCIGFSSFAAGWAVSTVGSAAMGAVSEKPELAGRLLIFVGLAEGIAIYGLIVAIMLIGKA